MFTTLIVQPIFNLLVLIYALLPGHNFGLAIILFTIVIRILLWPLVKKQLHSAKIMRELQPEVKRIKQQTKGDRQKEMQLTMELYKEREFNPYGSFPTLILQFIVLIGLYNGLIKVVHHHDAIVTFAYPSLQHLHWMQQLSHNIHLFDNTLFGVVDLTRAAWSSTGIYWPALIIVLGSAIMQYFQSKQLMPTDKNARSLRQILSAAGEGKQADQTEVNAAVGRGTRWLLPIVIFFVTVQLPAALGLYWLVGGIVAYIQQARVLKEDETEMEAMADKPSKDVKSIPEAEIVTPSKSNNKKKTRRQSKRRKK